MATVDIVLATYEGAPFLADQLDSILAQSFEDWRLIVRDDGSTDATPDVIERFRRRVPDRVDVVRDDDGTLGHAGNFARLLERSDAPYVALCDQDDVWLPEKLRRTLDELHQLEEEVGATTPCLAFTDAVVVDAELHTVAPSFGAHAGLRPEDASVFGRMLTRNVVAAHTALLNAALRDLARPIPPPVTFVDWWIALLAAAVGRTGYVAQPTVRYRQHASNASGARRPWTVSVRSGLDYVRRRDELERERTSRYVQAQALQDRLAGRMEADRAATLAAFLALPEMNVLERARVAKRHGLLPRHGARSVIFLWTAPRWVSAEPAPVSGRSGA